jgi:predicted nucleic acid-binding protein
VSGYVCIDANIAVKWLVTEDDTATAMALAERFRTEHNTLIAPPHMPVEVINVLRTRARRGELTPAEAEDLADLFAGYPIEIGVPAGLYKRALDLAHRFGRPTVYDTHYVALAELAGCDFWTADKKLVNALGGRLPFVRPLHTFAP